MAVGADRSYNYGAVVRVAGGIARKAQVLTNTGGLLAVACPTTTSCIAVAQAAMGATSGSVVPITRGVAGTVEPMNGVNPGWSNQGIACSSHTTCYIAGRGVGGGGVVVPVASGVVGAPIQVTGSAALTAITCPGTNLCVVAGLHSSVKPYGGAIASMRQGVPRAAQQVKGVRDLVSIACLSTTACVSVGDAHLAGAKPPQIGVVVGIANP